MIKNVYSEWLSLCKKALFPERTSLKLQQLKKTVAKLIKSSTKLDNKDITCLQSDPDMF
jgi:hypothetical protein